jgi:hypothetical protein
MGKMSWRNDNGEEGPSLLQICALEQLVQMLEGATVEEFLVQNYIWVNFLNKPILGELFK